MNLSAIIGTQPANNGARARQEVMLSIATRYHNLVGEVIWPRARQ